LILLPAGVVQKKDTWISNKQRRPKLHFHKSIKNNCH
jgi:hypothetical protein